jgi:hypothetical protein
MMQLYDSPQFHNITVTAAELLTNISAYIVASNFTLVDITGKATTWGHWDPPTLNSNRDWSDDRGINSLQVIGWIAAALNVTDPSSSEYELMAAGLNELASASNDYVSNLVNAKIMAPCDVTYFDDENTFLAYPPLLALLPAAGHIAGNITIQQLASAGQESLLRLFEYVRAERQSCWNVMFLSQSSSVADMSAADIEQLLFDAVWNLRTFPMELTRWPVHNSHRLDVVMDSELPGNVRTVLPSNERAQGRLDDNPYTADAGDGMIASDPGAWLLPYWWARANGVLSAATSS